MTKSWRDIQETHSKRSPEERAATKSRALRDLVIERMNLAQTRRARTMTQATIADVMEIAQGDFSRLEHRTDAYIGTIQRYIEALGGALRIVAEFPNGEPIEITASGTSCLRRPQFRLYQSGRSSIPPTRRTISK